MRNQYHRRHRERYDEARRENIERVTDRLEVLRDRYGGTILVAGRVHDTAYYDRQAGAGTHWKSTMYAPVIGIRRPGRPVHVSEFREFLTIVRQGTITPVMGDTFRQLKELIMCHNEVPSHLAEAVATPTPVTSINDGNWLEVNRVHRHACFLEASFVSTMSTTFSAVLATPRPSIPSACARVSSRATLASTT